MQNSPPLHTILSQAHYTQQIIEGMRTTKGYRYILGNLNKIPWATRTVGNLNMLLGITVHFEDYSRLRLVNQNGKLKTIPSI